MIRTELPAPPAVIHLDLESADPHSAVSDRELLLSDTYWEMQEEAELDAVAQVQVSRQNRFERHEGYYAGLDN